MSEGIKKISENVVIPNRAFVVTNKNIADNNAISIGALWSDATDKSLKIKTGQGAFSFFDAAKTLISGSIITNLLADKSVTEIKLADNAVVERVLASNSVASNKIKESAVIESKIANNAISSNKIKELNVLNNHLALNSVTNDKVLNKSLTGEKIKDNSIININLASDSINDRVITSKALKERHFDNECVSNRALAKESIYGSIIKEKGIASSHLDNNIVVTRTIANGAVTKEKIADSSIYNEHLTDGCVINTNLSTACVVEKNLATDSVVTEKIKNKSITKEKLANDITDLLGDPVKYNENDNVDLRQHLNVNGDVTVVGSVTANKIFNAVFMDIAEGYEPEKDTICIPGDIMQVNENGKLVKASPSSHFPIVGIVSDEYAACYGATEDELLSGKKIAIGLIGKVHVNVVGPVKLGDRIAVARDGLGASFNTNNLIADQIVGKALESNSNGEVKKVLCLIYPR